MIKVDGLKIEIFTENNIKYVSCKGERYPAYHIAQFVRLILRAKGMYDLNTTGMKIKEKMFGRYLEFSDLELIYKKLYSI